jgi:hypothetical protein
MHYKPVAIHLFELIYCIIEELLKVYLVIGASSRVFVAPDRYP